MGGGLEFNVIGGFTEAGLNEEKRGDLDVEAGLLDDLLQNTNIFEIPGIARVFLGDNQDVAAVRDSLENGFTQKLGRILNPVFAKIVKTGGKKIGVNHGNFKTSVANIHRRIERKFFGSLVRCQPGVDFQLTVFDPVDENFRAEFFIGVLILIHGNIMP